MINIKINSKDIVKGDTFIAIKGNNVDGHDYIEEAIKNGASKIVVEKESNYQIDTLVVKNTKSYLNKYLVKHYSKDLSKLKIIGITGTNGKTTSAYLTYQLLNKLGKKAAYIGTIGFYINGLVRELNNTTPDILTLYNLLYECIKYKCEYVVIEISSHSLSLKRIEGLKLYRGGFTNLTQDHLDYHKTMERYLKEKVKIKKYLNNDGKMIINCDDASWTYFKSNDYITYGYNADIKILGHTFKNNRTTLKFIYEGKEYTTKYNLEGKFNIYNYLLAIGIVSSLSININKIIKASKKIIAPPGRCETIKVRNKKIIIDYAHTPDAVKKIISEYKKIVSGNIYTIIGCGGDRDNTKRSTMGLCAVTLSDYVIFTNDNPRTESKEDIINDMLKDVTTKNYEIIYDRKNAIKEGMRLLSSKDVLLILGKGHENYQIIGRNKKKFSDREEVLKNK